MRYIVKVAYSSLPETHKFTWEIEHGFLLGERTGFIDNSPILFKAVGGFPGMTACFFSLYVFGEPAVHFHNFLLCCPSLRSAHSQVPSQVATHQEIGSQLWAGETLDSNIRTAGQQSVALPLSHHASRMTVCCLVSIMLNILCIRTFHIPPSLPLQYLGIDQIFLRKCCCLEG
jgi:hypothetical protein